MDGGFLGLTAVGWGIRLRAMEALWGPLTLVWIVALVAYFALTTKIDREVVLLSAWVLLAIGAIVSVVMAALRP